MYIYTKKPPRHTHGGYIGAGGRTRTGTVSLPVDFESTTSANSITPANFGGEMGIRTPDTVVTVYMISNHAPSASSDTSPSAWQCFIIIACQTKFVKCNFKFFILFIAEFFEELIYKAVLGCGQALISSAIAAADKAHRH